MGEIKMIDRRRRILFTIFIGMLLLAASGISNSFGQGNTPNFTGTWQTERRCRPYTVILTQAGNQVTGTFSPGNGKIINGVVTGNRLNFNWTEDGAEGFGEFVVNWDGKGFTGTSSQVKSSGAGMVVAWKTQTPAVIPFAGVWQTWIDRNQVSLTMVQSGDHVLGTYQGNGRLEGTISGKVLRFTWRSDSGTGSGRFIMEEKNSSFSGSFNRGSNPDDVDSTWSGRLQTNSESRPGPCDPLGVAYGYPRDPRNPEGPRGTGNISEAELARLEAEYQERMKNAPVAFDGIWQAKSGETFVYPQLHLQQPTSDKVVGHLWAGRPEMGIIKDGIVVRNTLRFTVWRPNPAAIFRGYHPDIQIGVGELVMDADGKSFKGTVMGAAVTGTRIAR